MPPSPTGTPEGNEGKKDSRSETLPGRERPEERQKVLRGLIRVFETMPRESTPGEKDVFNLLPKSPTKTQRLQQKKPRRN